MNVEQIKEEAQKLSDLELDELILDLYDILEARDSDQEKIGDADGDRR